MGTGVEAGSTSPHAEWLRKPTHSDPQKQPEVEAEHERPEQVQARGGFGRRAEWAGVAVLATIEVAWLFALLYVIHRYLLSPILG